MQAIIPTPSLDRATCPLPSDLSLHDLIGLSDDELARYDIAELHLRCAEGLPGAENIDIPNCLKALDDCAQAVCEQTGRLAYVFRRRPERFKDSQSVFRCAVLSTVLQERFHVKIDPAMNDMDELAFWKDARNSFLHGIVNGDLGMCLPMSIMYIAIGRRLGYPLKLVTTVRHGFARWEDEAERFNIECAIKGFDSQPDSYYLEWPHKMTPEQANDWRLLRSMTPRQELAQFFLHRGGCLLFTPRSNEAMEAIFWSHSLAPDDPKLVASLLRLLAAWRLGLEKLTPPWMPPVSRITWPSKRVFPDCVPIEAEREFIRLSIWDGLLKQPQYNPNLLCPPWQFQMFPPKYIQVRCG